MQHCTLEVLMANDIPVLESDQWMALLPVGSSQVYSIDSPGARKVLRSFLLQRNYHSTCEFLKSSYAHEHLQCIGHIEAVTNRACLARLHHWELVTEVTRQELVQAHYL